MTASPQTIEDEPITPRELDFNPGALKARYLAGRDKRLRAACRVRGQPTCYGTNPMSRCSIIRHHQPPGATTERMLRFVLELRTGLIHAAGAL